MQDEVDRQIDLMLENDIIQPSASLWASVLLLLRKMDQGVSALNADVLMTLQ